MLPDSKSFANDWIESWNSHDIDRILSHYSEDIEITTPMIKVALDIETGTLDGKENVKNYWLTALRKVPDLRFELIDVTEGIDSIAIYYKAVMNKMATEVLFFNESGKVKKVIVHYK
jgi:hypothetical protein